MVEFVINHGVSVSNPRGPRVGEVLKYCNPCSRRNVKKFCSLADGLCSVLSASNEAKDGIARVEVHLTLR